MAEEANPNGTATMAEVVARARAFRKVLVTGPQRSGTTIAARILASELGWRFVSEKGVKTHSLYRLHKRLFSWRREVIQGPCFCSICHHIDAPKTLIVFMRRPIEEIVASEQRIGWSYHENELANYFRDSGVISAVRYECWERFQRDRMESAFVELEHSALSAHPLWIEREQRAHFSAHQTA